MVSSKVPANSTQAPAAANTSSTSLTWLRLLLMTLTNAKTWIPLYLALLYIVIKSNRNNVKEVLLVLAAAGACVLLAGTIDDTIVKPLVARWRPGHDPEIGMLVDTVDDYRGGNYGFFSAHASNTFSIAVFFSLLMRQRLFTVFMVAWSLTNCWTRLYLGVHYPGDILVGLLWGGLVGFLVYKGYRHFTIPVSYSARMCYIPIATLCVLFLYAVIRGAITAY